MEIHCDLSRILLERLHRDEIDMAVALFPGGDQQYLVQQWQEQPVLGGEPECQHCPRRTGAAGHAPGRLRIPQPHDRCTDGARRDWRIAYSSPGIGGVQRAVLDGLGVSALTYPTLLPDMIVLDQSQGFPQLEPLHIGLFYKHSRLANAGHVPASRLIELVDATGSRTPPDSWAHGISLAYDRIIRINFHNFRCCLSVCRGFHEPRRLPIWQRRGHTGILGTRIKQERWKWPAITRIRF
jgi:DNA-binding transcriptional LysR family regulator